MDTMNDVKLVRITSGEEVLCTIIKDEAADYITIAQPTIIIPTQDRSIALAPWMPYAKTDTMDISRSAIAFIIEPVEQLATQYNEIHSKILVPNQKIIT